MIIASGSRCESMRPSHEQVFVDKEQVFIPKARKIKIFAKTFALVSNAAAAAAAV